MGKRNSQPSVIDYLPLAYIAATDTLLRIIPNNKTGTHEEIRKMLIFKLLVYNGLKRAKNYSFGSARSCEIPKANVTFVSD